MKPELRSPESRYKLITSLLGKHKQVLIHLTPSYPKTVLPKHLMQDATVTLKLSHYFENPLKITAKSIQVKLSFQNKPFDCFVPLDAILGCTAEDGKSYLFIGKEAEAKLAKKQEDQDEKEETQEKSTKSKPFLKRIK